MEAAQAGDIDALYAKIREEPKILNDFDEIPFAHTPLHVAASEGNTEFAVEMITLKPSFARKLNCDGFSPMHLALRNEKYKTALRLLDIDAELVRVKGRDGITPLHYAVEKGNLHVLTRFLSVCPKSVQDVTNMQSETPLHIALRNNNVEAFNLLFSAVQCLRYDQEARQLVKQVLNWKDKDGNTLLHLAIYKEQLEVVKCLINENVDVNVIDQNQIANEDIKNILGGDGSRRADRQLSRIINSTEHLLRLEQRLNEVARRGNVDALYALLREDPYLLERIDEVPFVDTPLHIAASAGNIEFSWEIMRLKPSFAKKLNQDGYSPMHLALEFEEFELFRWLLGVDRNLARVQGKEGKTSMHYVAEKEYPDLLSEVLIACPESIIDVTNRKENALHIAVKKGRLENLRVLLNWLGIVGKQEIVKSTDIEGNTLLDIAILSRSHDTRMVRLLIKRVGIDARNLRQQTALDILEPQEMSPGLADLLRIARAPNMQTPLRVETVNPLKKEELSLFEKVMISFVRSSRRISIDDKNREAILVVAVLIATATYQAALTPSQIVEPEYQQSSDNSCTTNIKYITWLPTKTALSFSDAFRFLNVLAFHLAMVQIHNRIPFGISLFLVYPLLCCFMLVMAIRSEALLFFFLSWLCFSYSNLPVFLIIGRSPFNWPTKYLRSLFKHYRSFHNEMTS